jgi:hypothetical protein
MTTGITAGMLDGGLAEDLAAAALAMARRFSRGATLWWAATQWAMRKTVDRCVHPDVHNGPSSGPNPYGGTE